MREREEIRYLCASRGVGGERERERGEGERERGCEGERAVKKGMREKVTIS